MLAALAGSALAFGAGAALAWDHEAGVPLTPTEAVGGWTLETGGHAVCMVRLTAHSTGQVTFMARAPGATCGAALPTGVAGWTPTHDGMALTDASGNQLISFNRWSNSLFVAHASSGRDIQLQRGGSGGQ